MNFEAIQREQQQELKIDKAIEKIATRWLKQNKYFRKVYSFKDATALLIFFRAKLSHFKLVYKEENDIIQNYLNDDRVTILFLKSTNPHDSNNSTLGHIKKKKKKTGVKVN